MTEQIENTIKTFNQLLFLGRVDLPKEEIENNIKTAIRSLQAWEEVLQELEYRKDRTASPTMLLAYSEVIDIINQHLADIKEVR